MTHRPTLIFGMPPISHLEKLIEEALQYHGFHVISLPQYSQHTHHYPSVRALLYAKYRKLMFKDTETAKQLKGAFLQKQLIEKIKQIGKIDYALFISGDIYGTQLLEFVQQNSKNGSVNYQFDGIHRFPAIEERIKLFNRFYVFDPQDLNHQGQSLLPATNFYFDHLKDHENLPIVSDFYFTAAHNDYRVAWINLFSQYAQQANWKLDFNILANIKHTQARAIYPHSNIQLIKHNIDFKENIKRAKQSKVLVDFVISDHKGLSFRTFEAIGYDKKLITTNAEVAKYDFYHPNNIFILRNQNITLDEIMQFLQQPYCPLDEKIKYKYSFGNWIKYILNIAEHEPIELPVNH